MNFIVIYANDNEVVKRFPHTPRKKSRIEIIPMIDVMMFLLVFFVLLSTNVIPSTGLKMKLPLSSSAANSQPPTRVIVSIPTEGPFQLDGLVFDDIEKLSQELKMRKQAATNGLAVIVQGDEKAALQRLVTIMDILKSNGIDSVSISAKRK